ncbi:MAG: MFS transporter [Verrucomicrobia bacterium Tous-C9LFEB]|nr:MAG: MFS transporter [Verrucomicrobia bacterium Tous-C9LFEB]
MSTTLENKPAQSSTKVWTAGTLTYSMGGIAALFFWLLVGDFAWSMREKSVGPMAQWYLHHLMVPNFILGLLVSSLPAVIQLFVGPFISVKSDRTRSKWGRRIPFLFITTPMAALGMVGLGLTPLVAKWLHQTFNDSSVAGAGIGSFLANEMIISVICFGICWTLFEVAVIAGKPVFDGLINDVVPQALLGRFYGLFRAVMLIDGMVFNFWVMGYVPTHFTLIMVSVGVFYGVAFFWVCLKVKEGQYPALPPVPEKAGVAGNLLGAAGTYCRECFSHPYYLSVFVMMMAAAVCFGPINTFAIPFAGHVGVDMKTYGQAVAFTYLISLSLAYFLGWMADRFHPLRLCIGVLIGYVAVTAWGSFYARNATTFLIAWILHGLLSGCYFTCAASLGQRLFPREKFAQYASAAALFSAGANIFLAPTMGSIIDLSGNTYRYTFAGSCLLAIIALVAACLVYGRFRKLGGPAHYIAPDYREGRG